MKGTIISRGILALGVSVALLAVTASVAGATKTLSPTSADFGDVQVGTTSPPQAFTLNVRCTQWFEGLPGIPGLEPFCLLADPFLATPALIPPGDFAETNDCPALMPGNTEFGTSCTINAAFAPTSPGPKAATLLTGLGGPTAALSGVGVSTPTSPSPPAPGPAPPSNGGAAPPGTQPGALALNLAAKRQKLRKRVTLFATVRRVGSARVAEAVTLVLGGKAITRTVRRLQEGNRTRVRAPLKRAARKRLARRLNRRGKARTKVVGAAVDSSGRTDRDRVKVRFRR